MNLKGRLIIGFERASGSATFHATDPARNAEIEPGFAIPEAAHGDRARVLAHHVFDACRATSPETRAQFLETGAWNWATTTLWRFDA